MQSTCKMNLAKYLWVPAFQVSLFFFTDLTVRLTAYSAQKKHQQWFFVDKVIRNLYAPTEALQVKRTDPRDGSKVLVAEYARKESQHWKIMYV